MATLTNPVTPQNIVDRFADYVTATANSGISWGTNALPFAEFPSGFFAGTTAGRGISISGGNLGVAGNIITAATIYNTLVSETATYTNIRNLQAVLFVDGGGGNTGSRPTPGVVYNQTAVAHTGTGNRQGIGSPAGSDVAGSNIITSAGLETLYGILRTTYNNYRGVSMAVQINVCHASCHSSCHSSRGRR